jgi:hypothetical protein
MRPGTFLVFLSALAAAAGSVQAGVPTPAARIQTAPARAMLSKGDASRVLVWGKDLQLAAGPLAPLQNVPLAFVGFGLRVPGAYDDFAGLGLAGHVAIIARRVPDLPVLSRLARKARSLAARIRRLDQAGAIGVIVLEDAPRPGIRLDLGNVDLPVLVMAPAALSPECGDLAARLRQITATGRPQSQDFIYAPWTTLTLEVPGRPAGAPEPRETH